MGAFCVFGISRSKCRKTAERKTSNMEGKIGLTITEWARRVAELADHMFNDPEAKREKVSPELDAPQFCRDWLAAQEGEVRQPLIMVRGPKIDKHGGGSYPRWPAGSNLVGVGRVEAAATAVR